MKSKFAGLSAVTKSGKKTKPVEDKKMGRPRRTSEGASPITLHMNPAVIRQARMKLLEREEIRPLSLVVEELISAWVAGKIDV